MIVHIVLRHHRRGGVGVDGVFGSLREAEKYVDRKECCVRETRSIFSRKIRVRKTKPQEVKG